MISKIAFFSTAAAALAAATLTAAGPAQAAVKYLADGATQNARGGWDLPKQGGCPADPTALTRPDCIARRYTAPLARAASIIAVNKLTTRGAFYEPGQFTSSLAGDDDDVGADDMDVGAIDAMAGDLEGDDDIEGDDDDL